MKKDTHPEYQDVLFVDTSTGKTFICGTSLKPKETKMHEGKEYPVLNVSTSSASHPFFTGDGKFVDAEGRIEKFKKRYAKKAPAAAPSEDKVAAAKESASKAAAAKAAKKVSKKENETK